MLHPVLESGVEEYLEEHCGGRDEKGHVLMTSNGRARERSVTVDCRTMKVRMPSPRTRLPRIDTCQGIGAHTLAWGTL
jgi:hypothetical protein